MQVIGQDGSLRTLVGISQPAGLIQSFGSTTPPFGWALCDGSAISRTVYATLFAAIGTTYGIGDGSTTFNLPDLRSLGAEIFDFRLTTLSGVAVTTADRTSQSTIYLTPYENGVSGATITTAGFGKLALYDGSQWNLYLSGELSLSLTSLTTATNYDVFVYDNSGTLTLELVTWTNSTTRATVLDLQDGVLCKHGALSHRYVGTIRTTGTTTTEDSAANRFVVNYYNRIWKQAEYITSTQYSTASTTYVQIGSIAVSYLVAVGDYSVLTTLDNNCYNSGTGWSHYSIGSGTTTEATNACNAGTTLSGTTAVNGQATLTEIPSAGLVTRYALFKAGSGTAYVNVNAGGNDVPTALRAMIQC